MQFHSGLSYTGFMPQSADAQAPFPQDGTEVPCKQLSALRQASRPWTRARAHRPFGGCFFPAVKVGQNSEEMGSWHDPTFKVLGRIQFTSPESLRHGGASVQAGVWFYT